MLNAGPGIFPLGYSSHCVKTKIRHVLFVNDPLVSIIMRSFNEGWALRETLPAVQAQEYRNWELIVIDSGSTDGSVDLIRAAKPRHFTQIQQETYNPSRVMNQGMELAHGDFGIFLNADATPQNANWLRPLVSALLDPRHAAVFGRQVPRSGCRAVFEHDYERCFGANRESAKWDHFFSMVNSGLRKEVWRRRGFLEKMQFSEDDEYTRWCRKQGYEVVYCPESVVIHSHNYTPRQAYRRSFGEGRALAAVWQGRPLTWLRTVMLGWLNDARRDLFFCMRRRRFGEWPYALLIRLQQRRAKLAGFRQGWSFYQRQRQPHAGSHIKKRFTLDGSQDLEQQLEQTCGLIRAQVQSIIPPNKLQALVLAGGYGRGEGGVLRTKAGDQPYNDLEFYVFLTGNRFWNERAFNLPLDELGRNLSSNAGVHVEFKIDSLSRMRRCAVSLFTYDLVAAHRLLVGAESVFCDCEQHLEANDIPISEASRLLLNRFSGLLLAREILRKSSSAQNSEPNANSERRNSTIQDNQRTKLSIEQADFVGRNLAKAQLCLGDAILVAFRQHHWSCVQRHRRLQRVGILESQSWLEEVKKNHEAGVQFKLHPQKIFKSIAEFEEEFKALRSLALKVWLWLENRRLGCNFSSVREYSFHRRAKCADAARWRNYLLNLRTFGSKAALMPLSWRYPRERLLNAMALLLWDGEEPQEPEVVRHLQTQLSTNAVDWHGFLAAYKDLWPQYA
jgi:rhamnosyltransferase